MAKLQGLKPAGVPNNLRGLNQARDVDHNRMPHRTEVDVDVELNRAAFLAFRGILLSELFNFPFVEVSPVHSSVYRSEVGELSAAKRDVPAFSKVLDLAFLPGETERVDA